MIISLIIGAILILGVLIFSITSVESTHGEGGSLACVIVLLNGIVFLIAYFSEKPSAMDVYKGKTELRITYDGKTPVDSVVIYKANKK